MFCYNPAPPCLKPKQQYLFSSDTISHSIGETSDQIRAILSPLSSDKETVWITPSRRSDIECWYFRWSPSPRPPSPPPLSWWRAPRRSRVTRSSPTSTNWSWSSPCWVWPSDDVISNPTVYWQTWLARSELFHFLTGSKILDNLLKWSFWTMGIIICVYG